MAEAANAESLRQNEAARARRRELAIQVRILQYHLDSLPNPKNYLVEKVFENPVSWGNFNFDAFRKLASEVSDTAAACAVAVESNMRRMAEIVDSLITKAHGHGFKWSAFPQLEWNDKMTVAESDLASILTELSSNP